MSGKISERLGTLQYLVILTVFVARCTYSAPVQESEASQLTDIGPASKTCYYNFQHYNEGARIVTNEPCLNCTCHNEMLMCYLRVCPFTKAIGQDCTVEKRPDQCCPIITCPEVPVQLLTSTTPSSPYDSSALLAHSVAGTNEVGFPDTYGCNVNNRFYADGAQLPVNHSSPCELCYCIRNRTTCLMQECTLRVAGCKPIYQPGICCPVRYNCEYEESFDNATSLSTPGLILTTTVAPGSPPPQCHHEGKLYDDGELIYSKQPCQHCYCFRGDIACAVQDCGKPMEIHGKNCTAHPPPDGECCPTTYLCDVDEAESATERLLENQPQTVSDTFPGADNTIPGEKSIIEERPSETFQTAYIESDALRKGAADKFDEEDFQTTISYNEHDETVTIIPQEDLSKVEHGIKYDEPSHIEEIVPEIAKEGKKDVEPNTTPIPDIVESSSGFFDESVHESITERRVESDFSIENKIQEASTVPPLEEDDGKLSTEVPERVDSSPSPTPVEIITEPSAESETERVTEIIEQVTEPGPFEEQKEETVKEEHSSPVETVTEGFYDSEEPETSTAFEIQTVRPNVPLRLPEHKAEDKDAVTENLESAYFEAQTTQEAVVSPDDKMVPSFPSDDHEIVPTTTAEFPSETNEDKAETAVSESERELTVPPAFPTEQFTTEQSVRPQVVEQTTILPALIQSSEEEQKVTEYVAITKEPELTTISVSEDVTSSPWENPQSASAESEVDRKEFTTEPNVINISTEQEVQEVKLPQEVTTGEYLNPTTIMPSPAEPEDVKEIEKLTEDKQETTTELSNEPSVTEIPRTSEEPEKEVETTTEKIEKQPEIVLPEVVVPEAIVPEVITPEAFAPETTTGFVEVPSVSAEFAAITPETASVDPSPSPAEESTSPESLSYVTEGEFEVSTGRVKQPGIPGEGNCLVDGQSYANNSAIPPVNSCQLNCICISSIVQCELLRCPPPPEDTSTCTLVKQSPDYCCPLYVCEGFPNLPPASDNHLIDDQTQSPSTNEIVPEASPAVTSEISQPAVPEDQKTFAPDLQNEINSPETSAIPQPSSESIPKIEATSTTEAPSETTELDLKTGPEDPTKAVMEQVTELMQKLTTRNYEIVEQSTDSPFSAQVNEATPQAQHKEPEANSPPSVTEHFETSPEPVPTDKQVLLEEAAILNITQAPSTLENEIHVTSEAPQVFEKSTVSTVSTVEDSSATPASPVPSSEEPIHEGSLAPENYEHDHDPSAIPEEQDTEEIVAEPEAELPQTADDASFGVNAGTVLDPDQDYAEEDQAAYGPGTCRYGGKIYMSAQQIPREDPCDFCFCFRSDIICLQQSCPPPIPSCHEEPISGFCCPRYECPVSMATSVNLTTTPTTTTILPPHFLSHPYKNMARRGGCQIQGQVYEVGDTIPTPSGPCTHCTCGGDGNMQCVPQRCEPEPKLKEKIATTAARRRKR